MLGGDANREIDLKHSGGPMSYSLDYDRSNQDLIIKIIPEFRRDPDILEELSPRYRHIRDYEQMTGTAYIPPTESVWGFGPVLAWEPGGVLDVIRCRIPTKTETTNRWAISASLELLFSALKFWSPPEQPERQLTVIGGMIVNGTGNAGIGTYFTPEAAAWMRQQPVGPDIEVTEAIRSLFPGDEGAHDRRYIEVRSDRAGAPASK